jgi:hypothetical protein
MQFNSKTENANLLVPSKLQHLPTQFGINSHFFVDFFHFGFLSLDFTQFIFTDYLPFSVTAKAF